MKPKYWLLFALLAAPLPAVDPDIFDGSLARAGGAGGAKAQEQEASASQSGAVGQASGAREGSQSGQSGQSGSAQGAQAGGEAAEPKGGESRGGTQQEQQASASGEGQSSAQGSERSAGAPASGGGGLVDLSRFGQKPGGPEGSEAPAQGREFSRPSSGSTGREQGIEVDEDYEQSTSLHAIREQMIEEANQVSAIYETESEAGAQSGQQSQQSVNQGSEQGGSMPTNL